MSLRTLFLLTATTLLAGGLTSACGEATPDDTGTLEGNAPYVYVPEGKSDDYRSTTGREYSLLAIDSVQLPVADAELTGAEREARVEELVQLRFKALSYFIYAYTGGKSSSDDNYGYGGFRTTIRQKTFEQLDISERLDEPGTFDFLFEAEVGGPTNLLAELPLEDDGRTFQLLMPKLTTSELESGSYSRTYSHFDARDYDADQLESLPIEIEAKPSEPDAYPDYQAMFDDGLFDVAIHLGGDYNDARYDIVAAKDIFARLQSDLGLEAPVDSYDALRSDSGPFVGEFDANGRTVRFEVTLIHPDMQAEDGVGYDGLLELYRESASRADVVFYDGHAGYDTDYSGVVVHYNPRYAIAAADFDELDLPEKYQLFVFNGCKTYTSYADAMYDHPAKTTANLDIVSTVNFSWLSEMTRVTTDFLGHMTATADGTHLPRSYDAILADLNRGRSWDVIYGVHGLSDNARRSPYADEAALCSECASNSDCPGIDNLCIQGLSGAAACAMACTDDSGCPTGYSCESAATKGSDLISASQCVPSNGTCE